MSKLLGRLRFENLLNERGVQLRMYIVYQREIGGCIGKRITGP